MRLGGRSQRARAWRRAWVPALLAVAMLVLSGCWGVVVGESNGSRALVIRGFATDKIIRHCTQTSGTGHARGWCALRRVDALCTGLPLPNLPREWCLSFTWEDHIVDIENAIVEVLTTSDECLVARFGPLIIDWAAMPRGLACVR